MGAFKLSRRALFFLVIGLSGLDLGLGLWAIHWKWFSTADAAEFSGIVLDFVSLWTGRLVWLAGAGLALVGVFKRKDQATLPNVPEDKYAGVRAVASEIFLRSKRLPIVIVVVQLGIAGWAALILLETLPYVPPSAQILATPYVHPMWPPGTPKSTTKKIYLANDAMAKLTVYDWDYIDSGGNDIRFGNQQNPIRPSFVAYSPRRELLLITVRDQNKLLLVDTGPGHREKAIAVGNAPGSIAISPDERKAYVSNLLPAHTGTISVVDLATQKVVKTIAGVNCPMGIALTPDGKHLYVASQCGGGEDPVFVIDTDTNTVSKSIPHMAVGSSVLVSRDSKHVFVQRSSYQAVDARTNSIIWFPDQLSMIETSSNKEVKTIPCAAGISTMANTPDGKFLILGSHNRLIFLDPGTLQVITTLLFNAETPRAIAASEDGVAYVWLQKQNSADKNRVYVQGLAGVQKNMGTANLLGCKVLAPA